MSWSTTTVSAYLLKEQLRQIYRLPADAPIALLDAWIEWPTMSPGAVRQAREDDH